MNIAQRLQELLCLKGISRSRLAREIGVHTSTVSNWLDGKEVKAENLSSLCAYFGCSLDYLAGQISAQEKAPTMESERGISDNDLMFGLWGDSDDVDEEDLADVKRYAQFVRERKRDKRK